MTSFLRKYGIWCVLGLTALIFAPSLPYHYMQYYDDYIYVFGNPDFAWSWEGIYHLLTKAYINLYTPLQMASYWVDFAVGGMTPWVFRMQNILWHLAAVYLAYRLIRELGAAKATAVLVTCFFAIHPQRVESVVWIAERKDVLSCTFFLLALNCQLSAERHGKRFSPWGLAAMALACLAKPQSVMLPAVLYLVELHQHRKLWKKEYLYAIMPYAGVTILYLAATSLAGKSPQTSNLLQAAWSNWDKTLLLAGNNYLTYFGKTYLPQEMMPLYPFFQITPQAWFRLGAGVAAILAILAAVWKFQRSYFWYTLLPFLLIFAGFLFPVSGVVAFSDADFADRYSYIPSVFLWAALALFLDRVHWSRWRWSPVLAAGYGAFLVFMTVNYMPIWQNDRTFLLTALTGTEKPHFNAAMRWVEYCIEKKQEQEIPLALDKIHPYGWRDTGLQEMLYYHKNALATIYGVPPLPQQERRRRIRLLNRTEDLYLFTAKNYSNIFIRIAQEIAQEELRCGKITKAAAIYEKTGKSLNNRPFEQAFYQGLAAYFNRKPQQAIEFFEAALRIVPDDAQTLANLTAARKMAADEEKRNGNQPR